MVPTLKKLQAANLKLFSSQGYEPQNCCQGSGYRQVWAKIDSDKHRAGQLLGHGRRVQRIGANKSDRKIIDKV
jgi:hypothetical protein